MQTNNIMKPIKVLEVIRQGEIGGGESHVLDLISGFDRNEVEPVAMAFTGGHMIETLEKQGVKCHVVCTQKAFDLGIQEKITRIIREEGIELIHAHGSRAASNLIWAARKTHLPMVYTVHGWSFHQDQNRLIYKLRAWSEKLICSNSKQVICVSESNRQSGVENFGLNRKCRVIENGINLNRFNAARQLEDLREVFHIARHEFIIGFIGRITLQKAPLDLVKAIAIAHAANPDIKGLLVGEGDMEEEVRDYIRKEGLEDCFYLSGFRTDVPEVLKAMDVFCLPSLWEGLSIALLEAMAMEKAIVVTPTDGTREIMEDHTNGLIVPYNQPRKLAEAFLEYERDRALKDMCGRNARRLIKERFDSQRVSQEVTNIYKNILK